MPYFPRPAIWHPRGWKEKITIVQCYLERHHHNRAGTHCICLPSSTSPLLTPLVTVPFLTSYRHILQSLRWANGPKRMERLTITTIMIMSFIFSKLLQTQRGETNCWDGGTSEYHLPRKSSYNRSKGNFWGWEWPSYQRYINSQLGKWGFRIVVADCTKVYSKRANDSADYQLY